MARNLCTGIVLAGGKSSRMGTEKGLVDFMGSPMIEYAVHVLELVSGNVIISTNSDLYDYLSKETVKDSILNVGPGAGIAAALNKSASEINVIVPCDMPHLSHYFLEYMLSKYDGSNVMIPVFEERSEPLCAIIRKQCTEAIEWELRNGVNKLTDIYESIGVNYFEVEGSEPGFSERLFNNYNRPSDVKF